MLIYKILRTHEWADLRRDGQTAGAPVDLADGFVHFSTAAQLPETLARHFATESPVMLLACSSDGMGSSLRWEVSRNGDLFPHLYRQLAISDIRWSRPIVLGANGHDIGELE